MYSRRFQIISVVIVLFLNSATDAVEHSIERKYFSEPLIFKQFDTDTGTLSSIRIDITLNISGGQMNYDNDSPAPVDGTLILGILASLDASTDVALFDDAGEAIFENTAISVFNNAGFHLAGDDGDGLSCDNSLPDGGYYNGKNISGSDWNYIGKDFWNIGNKGFLGSGDFELVLFTASLEMVECDQGIVRHYGFPPSFDGFVEISYSYEPVPEPSTFIIMIVSCVLIKKWNPWSQ